MISPGDLLKSLAKEGALSPQEQLMEVGKKSHKLFIGIPKETSFQENRVALVPSAVAVLVNNGHEVLIETGAGKKANFQDNDYSEAGAQICYETEQVYKCHILFKVAPPSTEEIAMMQRGQTLVSALQLTIQPKDFLKRLMAKKVTAIAWDYIKDEDDIYPVVRAMGEIAGNTSILIAAELLSNINGGAGLMLGGISGVSSTEVVIIGAGTVGEYAARAAIGLGAMVKVFDNSIYKLRRLQNDLGQRLSTSIIHPEILKKELVHCDVAIGALRPSHGRTPCVVSEDMVSKMKHGSVIVDISIDQGGCFETSEITNHTNPVFRKYGVAHYCVPNIASRVSRTASYALSNIFTPTLINMGDCGGIKNLIKRERGFRHGVYLYNGTLTSPILGEAFGLPYKEMELLMAAF